MDQFQHISAEQVLELLKSDKIQLVDIRDPKSFALAHIDGAIALSNDTLSTFVANADMEKPVVVVCYHGVSSQGAAQYLIELGFDEVFSMDGGFEAWRRSLPFVATV